MLQLVPILIRGYHPTFVSANPAAAQFAALDELFARYPILTLTHIAPGLLFMLLGPLQFHPSLRAHHPRWHRTNGRIFLFCGLVIGVSALVMTCYAGYRRRQSAAATTLFAMFFLFALGKAFWHSVARKLGLTASG